MPYIPIEENPNMNLNMDAVTDKTLVVDSEMNPRYKQLLENDKSLAYPTFDDSGSVSGITSFNDFLGTLKSRMRIFDFYKNFKAGMQFVMHLGRAANNCTTTAEGLYLDARQGKVLMDLYTKLNSDLISVELKRKSAIIDPGGNIFIDIPLPDCTGFALAQNGSTDTVMGIYVIGTTFYNNLKILRCHLNTNRTGHININVIYK
jgi:hypothetical protein